MLAAVIRKKEREKKSHPKRRDFSSTNLPTGHGKEGPLGRKGGGGGGGGRGEGTGGASVPESLSTLLLFFFLKIDMNAR